MKDRLIGLIAMLDYHKESIFYILVIVAFVLGILVQVENFNPS